MPGFLAKVAISDIVREEIQRKRRRGLKKVSGQVRTHESAEDVMRRLIFCDAMVMRHFRKHNALKAEECSDAELAKRYMEFIDDYHAYNNVRGWQVNFENETEPDHIVRHGELKRVKNENKESSIRIEPADPH